MLTGRLERRDDVATVGIGQPDVHDEDVQRGGCSELGQGLAAVMGDDDLVPGLTQGTHQHLADRLLVLAESDGQHGSTLSRG